MHNLTTMRRLREVEGSLQLGGMEAIWPVESLIILALKKASNNVRGAVRCSTFDDSIPSQRLRSRFCDSHKFQERGAPTFPKTRASHIAYLHFLQRATTCREGSRWLKLSVYHIKFRNKFRRSTWTAAELLAYVTNQIKSSSTSSAQLRSAADRHDQYLKDSSTYLSTSSHFEGTIMSLLLDRCPQRCVS